MMRLRPADTCRRVRVRGEAAPLEPSFTGQRTFCPSVCPSFDRAPRIRPDSADARSDLPSPNVTVGTQLYSPTLIPKPCVAGSNAAGARSGAVGSRGTAPAGVLLFRCQLACSGTCDRGGQDPPSLQSWNLPEHEQRGDGFGGVGEEAASNRPRAGTFASKSEERPTRLTWQSHRLPCRCTGIHQGSIEAAYPRNR